MPTPPRDPKDNKCANCNQVGHTKESCPKPLIAMEEMKCHICNKTGHIARICPDKDKRPAGKPALMAPQSPAHFWELSPMTRASNNHDDLDHDR